MMQGNPCTYWTQTSLRIKDVPELHKEIISKLGNGSHHHKEGDVRSENPSRRWKNSIWCLDIPLPDDEKVIDHLDWLSAWLTENKDYLRTLMARGAIVDTYVSYACDEDHRGFSLALDILGPFVDLGIKLEFSVMQ